MKLGRIDGPMRRSIGVCPCVGTGPPTCTKWPTLMSHHRLSTTLVPRATSDFAVFGEKRSHRPRFFLTPTCAPAQGVCAQTAWGGWAGVGWGGGQAGRGVPCSACPVDRARGGCGWACSSSPRPCDAVSGAVPHNKGRSVQASDTAAVPSACRVEAVGASVRGCD